MNEQEKRRLYIVVAILIAAVILLFLFGKRSAATVVNEGDFTAPDIAGNAYNFGSLPPLNYSGAKVGSRGCAACFGGYSRIVTPNAPAPQAAPQQVVQYLVQQFPAPKSQAFGGGAFSSSGPGPEKKMCPGPTGRWWPC